MQTSKKGLRGTREKECKNLKNSSPDKSSTASIYIIHILEIQNHGKSMYIVSASHAACHSYLYKCSQ